MAAGGFIAGGAAGGPPGLIIGGILTAISGFLSILGRGASAGINALGTAVRTLGGATYSAVRQIVNGLRWAFRGGLASLIKRVWNLYQTLRERIRQWIEPVIRYLQKVREYWDLIFNTYVLPVLDMIQRLRQVLLVFRLFNLKFAEKLDAQLLLLQHKIAEPFEEVRRRINSIINTLYVYMDPLGRINAGVYLQTAARSIGELIALIHRARLLWPPPLPSAAERTFRGYFDPPQVRQRKAAHRASGITTTEREMISTMRTKIREAIRG